MVELNFEEIKFQVKRYATAYTFVTQGIVIPDGNITVEATLKKDIMKGIFTQVRMVLNTLTQEHYQLKYPRTWWDAVKARWFPKWLLRKFPVEYSAVYTTHVFPEMAVPTYGKEFVTMKVKPYEALEIWQKE